MQTKYKKHNWKCEEYILILRAYFAAMFYPKYKIIMTHTYKIRKKNNLDKDLDTAMNLNKITNIRRYILHTHEKKNKK